MRIPRPAPRAKGVAVSDDGVRIAWYRYGSGEPVVLFVPTWNIVDARVWGSQVVDLQDSCTVITFDPRGHGASDRPSSGYDFTHHAADALAVLDANGVEHAAIVSASRGINAAALLAVEHPSRVDRLAVVAPYLQFEVEEDPGFWGPQAGREGWDLYNAQAWVADWPAFARFFMAAVFTEPDSAEVIDEVVAIMLEATPELIVAQERELDWSRAPALLPSIACPTLLIHGDSDVTLSVAAVLAVAARIPGARVELVPGGGHRPDIRTPERVDPALVSFVLGADPG